MKPTRKFKQRDLNLRLPTSSNCHAYTSANQMQVVASLQPIITQEPLHKAQCLGGKRKTTLNLT